MFEMLGNWSFGDYFLKKRSLGLGVLVDVYGIDKIVFMWPFWRWWSEGLERDTGFYDYWAALIAGIAFSTVIRITSGKWAIKDLVDLVLKFMDPTQWWYRKVKIDGLESNSVTIHKINLKYGIWYSCNSTAWQMVPLKNLPAQLVDTGMGWAPDALPEKSPTMMMFSNSSTEIETMRVMLTLKTEDDIAVRVIFWSRTCRFFFHADGQLPSNTGLTVIHRILRRAIRYGYLSG
jgi:alanyl-tRNA synthetase